MFSRNVPAKLSTLFAPNERADGDAGHATLSAHNEMHRKALQAPREAILTMRASDEIGDDAFHRLEEELDWLEMAGDTKSE
jgi:monovalent cation/hydrogen antiporter